ncbi:phosphatidylserine decarboxylase [Methylomonas paludis]|uniref:Phosphatidylserine decarboxylase proenzyme n=1 Tax=Methylomonas paludis TaxID=1173101 RepID=A0A975ML84_9GAMM|nr:archaetidylserine decarboxylase [Methylomonas paludis]QWF69474.1 phosphatidylserine decarboxylase [Methylomonas paludis]
MTFKEILAVWPQYILPQHLLSGWMSKLTHCENRWFKNLFIRLIIKLYGVNLSEAQSEDLSDYASFNAFFTRELKADVRSLAGAANAIASPADGAISQLGRIEAGQIFQAKGHHYTVQDLLGGDAEQAKLFANGSFATIYLSPKDYHRLHMPFAGVLKEMVHVPGKLFSVNTVTVGVVPGLFARNERVVCLFDTEIGPMALILVGAIFVNSIETVWHGVVTPPTLAAPRSWQYQQYAPILSKGAEMGRFNMGSTIIVLFGENAVQWRDNLQAGTVVRLGESLGTSTL